MTLLTSGQKTSQRSDGHKSLVYLSVNKPTTLLTAVVDGVTTRGATAIAFRDGSGTTTGIREGQTLRVTIDGRVFTTRVVSFSGTASAGTITVDPNGIAWEDGAGLELVENYELRVIPPTFDPNTGISTKRGQTWSNQTLAAGIPPYAKLGPHRAGFLSGGSLVYNLAGSGVAMAPGATITGFLWETTGGVIAAPTSASTTLTLDAADEVWISLTVTDSNSNTHTGHRRVWAHDPDPESADYPYVDFVVSNMTIGRDGSGSVDVTVHGVADFTEFVDGALVVFWQRAWYGGAEGPISLITGGENILFAGYILADTVDYDWQHGTVKFRAVTPVELMKQFRLQGLSIHAENAPAYWFQYDHRPTVARMLHWHGYWHSTLFEVADVTLPASTEYKKLFKFNEGMLYSQWQDLASKLFATVGCNKAGQIFVERDIQMLDVAGRAAVDVITEITPADLRETASIIRRHKNQVNVVRLSGWKFDGQTLIPYCSIAPNKLGADSGPGGQNLDGIVVASQAEANMLTGRVLARENNDVGEVRLRFSGNYSALDVAPQRWLTMTLAAGDTPRGIEWTDQRLAIQQVMLSIDQVNGAITTDVVCEPEAFGPDGVDDPCPLVPADETEETAPWSGEGEEALVAFSSVNLRPDSASDWTEKHAGSTDHGCIDPHWQARQGSVNPNDVIVWWVDGAKVYRSVDGGITAQDVTPAIDPPDTWSDTPEPGIENLTFVGVFADRWNQGRFLALARWQNGSALWRGWLAITEDDGLTWAWVDLYDGVSLPAGVRPIWLAVNGTYILATVWEDDTTDTLKLLSFNAETLAFDAEFGMGAAGETDVFTNKTYIAYAATVLDDDDLWFVFGRMNGPQSLSNPEHIIKTTDAGSNWSSVVNDWSGDYCAALEVGLDDSGNRDVWAVRQ